MIWRVVYADGAPGAAVREFPTRELAKAFIATLRKHQLLTFTQREGSK